GRLCRELPRLGPARRSTPDLVQNPRPRATKRTHRLGNRTRARRPARHPRTPRRQRTPPQANALLARNKDLLGPSRDRKTLHPNTNRQLLDPRKIPGAVRPVLRPIRVRDRGLLDAQRMAPRRRRRHPRHQRAIPDPRRTLPRLHPNERLRHHPPMATPQDRHPAHDPVNTPRRHGGLAAPHGYPRRPTESPEHGLLQLRRPEPRWTANSVGHAD